MSYGIIHSVILGVVQGATEFLPVSSTAHLVIIPKLFHWPDLGLKLEVSLHFGTVIAILAFFWRDWIYIIKSGLGLGSKKTDEGVDYDLPKNTLWQILLASIPAAIAGLALDKYAERYLNLPVIIMFAMAIFGIIIYLVDKYSPKTLELSKIGYKQSFLIGLAQCVALIPGVSRSGITMLAARSNGLSRENSAKYAFLLGTPATLGAFLLELRKITASDLTIAFFAGIIVSMITGILVIKFLLDYLKKNDFSIFVWYRLAFALVVLITLVLKI